MYIIDFGYDPLLMLLPVHLTQNYLSESQQRLVYEYKRELQEQRQHELRSRVQAALQDRSQVNSAG